ncbi:hypothetical protein, partial [Vibrio sp. VA3]|uniref:hypothetical protein n=1 Tax=Vibrio sp. VA3 TaxID=2992765 RepID=UPI00237A8A47
SIFMSSYSKCRTSNLILSAIVVLREHHMLFDKLLLRLFRHHKYHSVGIHNEKAYLRSNTYLAHLSRIVDSPVHSIAI